MAVYISPIASITPQICSEQATRQSTTTTISERPKMRTFGNAITNLEGSLLRDSGRASCEVYAKRRSVCPLKTFYQEVPNKRPLALVGSSGFLEIAISGGSAEKALGLTIGTRVVLRADFPILAA
jgi:S-adenosylmethionine hydrolase